MPAYQNTPFYSNQQLIPGLPVYLFGTYNMDQGDSRIMVTNTALTSNVATVTGLLVAGPVPVIGGTISLQQTQNGSGAYNVSRATITAVTVNLMTAVITVTFALTHANIATGADTGLAVADAPEIPEAIAAGASVSFCIQQQPTQQNGARTIAVSVTFPGGFPTAVIVSLQAAIHDVDSEFATIGDATQVSAGAYVTGFSQLAEFTLTEAQYYRVLVSALTGTSNIVCKVLA